ncbi:MAG: NAD(P)H-hydrate epimerase [Candidatus Omnitrophota bacterium]
MAEGISVAQIRGLEEKAKALGFSERTLIENASSNFAEIIDHLSLGKKALIIAGKGNNGADSLACGRKLANRGYTVSTILVNEKEFNQEALAQKQLIERFGAALYTLGQCDTKLTSSIEENDFIVDGILGIGVRGVLAPFLQGIINTINATPKLIVACDIPSGLSPDTGIALPVAIRASYTVTFIAAKRGFFLNQGPSFCGKILVTDIGISRELLEKALLKK